MSEETLRAAVAASALAGEEAEAELLRSIVEVARAIFEAEAASISTYDERADELVFQAMAGAGSGSLIGSRFPATEGIAGWVLAAREPLVVDDVRGDPRFARDVAEGTGYVPVALLAAPLLREDRALGVLSVLDPATGEPFGVAQMDLLALFARQAAIALDVVARARGAGAALERDDDAAVVAHVAGALARLGSHRREAGIRLLGALDELLSEEPGRR
jgi:GAF domain-containing protein